jgi:hypothetical protein
MKELRTNEIQDVIKFVEQNAGKLETAELSIRSSAGNYIAELRSTDEPTS